MEINLQLARYIPYDTIIHRFDPRFKIISLLLIMVASFLNIGFTGLSILFFLILAVFFLSKAKFSLIWRTIRFVLVIFIVIFIINFFIYINGIPTDGITHSPNAIQLGSSDLYFEPIVLFFTLTITIRIFILMLGSQLFIMTTRPTDITNSLQDLMKPLKIIKFPVESVAFVISIAIRFIPTILIETTMILNAQASRGVDFRSGKISTKVKSLTALIVPLVINSFTRSDELSDAIEVRGYRVDEKRTRYHFFKIKLSDVLLFSFVLLIFSYMFALQLDAWVHVGFMAHDPEFAGVWIGRILDPEFYGFFYNY